MKALLRGVLAALSMTAFACSAQDAPAKFEEGKQYTKVVNVEKPADARRIVVNEFFWYGCPHCFAFDPYIESWSKGKPADVDFVRVPNSLGRPVGVMHSKAFYAAEQLKLLDKMHKPLFEAFHNQNALNNEDQIAAVFTRVTGIMPDVVKGTMGGFSVDNAVRAAEKRSREFGISSVPTIVVGGKYTTDATKAGGFPGVVKVIDFLVDKVRKERAGQ